MSSKLVQRVQRWQQLSRYYVNKWHYDGSKWAERFWYGEGRTNPAMKVAVPFMITRNMRQQLETKGFPSHEISSLVPSVAHQLITDQVTYADFQKIREEMIAAEAQEEQKEVAAEVATTNAVAVVEQSSESEYETASAAVAPTDASQLAVVTQLKAKQQ